MPELRRRILLVEDEDSLVVTLRDRLQSEGYDVDVALDGDTAVEMGVRPQFDLLILDVALPRKNGFDVCRDLRGRGVQTPVLMLTARGQIVDRVVGLKLGADDYLTKPFDMSELLEKVWGYEAMPVTRTVDVHVASLRQKLETNPSRPEHFVTVHGLGYKFMG